VGFDLHFSSDDETNDIEASFHELTGHLFIFVEDMSIKIICPFFSWVIFVLYCLVSGSDAQMTHAGISGVQGS
jgi:hypothetical protein